jgi:hypothetical protein
MSSNAPWRSALSQSAVGRGLAVAVCVSVSACSADVTRFDFFCLQPRRKRCPDRRAAGSGGLRPTPRSKSRWASRRPPARRRRAQSAACHRIRRWLPGRAGRRQPRLCPASKHATPDRARAPAAAAGILQSLRARAPDVGARGCGRAHAAGDARARAAPEGRRRAGRHHRDRRRRHALRHFQALRGWRSPI